MKMSMEQLNRVAANLRKIVADEKLDKPASLKKAVGKIFDDVDDAHGGEEYVEVTDHPSDKTVTVIHYQRRTGQTPIMLIVRPGGIKVMITSEHALDGYNVFDKGEDGDVMQDRTLPDFGAVMKELVAIATAKGPPAAAPGAKVKDTALAFEFTCGACGKKAAMLQKGNSPGDDHLVYFDMSGARRWVFSASASEEMAGMLAKGDLAALQAYVLQAVPFRAVFDAYCPTCDEVACSAHAKRGLNEVTCAKGHKRAVKA